MAFDEIISPWFWTMGFGVFLCKYGLFWDLSKIHDNIEVVWVANEIKPCGVKIFSSTFSPQVHWLVLQRHACVKVLLEDFVDEPF